jgi:hypothetical protein
MPSIFEWVIITAIIVGIGYVGFIQARRGGQANPVSTRKLESELRTLSGKVGAMGGTVTDLKIDVKALGAKVDQVERESVTRDDIDALKELIEAKHQARGDMMNRVEADLSIIKNYLLEKGLGGR